MAESKKYDKEYKVQAVKLAEEVGTRKAAQDLGIPRGTLEGWVRKAKEIEKAAGEKCSVEDVMNLAEEVQMLRKKVKEQQKEIVRLEEMNEFLEEASAFFAASCRKSGKRKIKSVFQ